MNTFWTGLLIAVALVVVIAAGSMTWLQWRLNQETVSPLTVTNQGGTAGRALIVYQPGLGTFPTRVAEAFGEGLAASGWEVSMTTASSQAPAAAAEYDLVALGSPVYSGAPGKPLARYVGRVGDFGGKPVMIILTAAGTVDSALDVTRRMVADAGGRTVGGLGLTTMRPNDEADRYTGSNVERAVQIARHTGESLQLAKP